MSKPVLHGASLSPFVRKTRVALTEKGIDYDLIPVMPFGERDEYKKMSPLGKIPCYQEGDFTLPDSSAIIAYLERKQPKPSLYPSDAHEFGRALWYEEYADTKLAEVCTVPFVERYINAKFMGKEANEARIKENMTEKAPPVFDYLESELEGREYLAGGQFSVADIATASFFVNMRHGGEVVDASRWPNLAAYLERIHGRPSYKAIIEEEMAG
jgi:glutathione S-transferase